jgi:hypothetical protein
MSALRQKRTFAAPLQERGEWSSGQSVKRIPLTDIVEFGEPY